MAEQGPALSPEDAMEAMSHTGEAVPGVLHGRRLILIDDGVSDIMDTLLF